MTERYLLTGSRVFLEFNDKDPEATSDYAVDFAAQLDTGFELTGTPAVEIEAAGNGESPIEMSVVDESAAVAEPPVGSPALTTVVTFWLEGGTAGVRYRGKIKCDSAGPGSPAPPKTLVKRFYVVARLT